MDAYQQWRIQVFQSSIRSLGVGAMKRNLNIMDGVPYTQSRVDAYERHQQRVRKGV